MPDVAFVLISYSHFQAWERAQALRSSDMIQWSIGWKGCLWQRSHVCRCINEGHDIKSASDMAEGWIRSLWCQASIILLRLKSQARPWSTQCLGSCPFTILASSVEVWECGRPMMWVLVNVSGHGFGRPVRVRKWSQDRKWSRTANDPQIGPQMVPDRKWSPHWTANDPNQKIRNGMDGRIVWMGNWRTWIPIFH